jgi:hypothetical protein
MKASIIIVMLIIGAILRPQTAPSSNGLSNEAGPVVAVAAHDVHSTAGILTAVEMTQTVGGEATGCFLTTDKNGDSIGMCCLNLWLFELCVGVNLSAIDRLLPF